jgi:hypothetical protein
MAHTPQQPRQQRAAALQPSLAPDGRGDADPVPQTPSQTHSRSSTQVEASLCGFGASLRKAAQSATPKKCRPRFVNRFTNDHAWEAWDIDDRLVSLNSQFQEMKKMIDGSILDRKGIDEALTSQKEKGECGRQSRGDAQADAD